MYKKSIIDLYLTLLISLFWISLLISSDAETSLFVFTSDVVKQYINLAM